MVTNLMRTAKDDSDSLFDKMSPQVATADQRFNSLSLPTSDLSPEAQLDMNVSEKNYVSATHWTAILKNVGLSREHLKFIADYA